MLLVKISCCCFFFFHYAAPFGYSLTVQTAGNYYLMWLATFSKERSGARNEDEDEVKTC